MEAGEMPNQEKNLPWLKICGSILIAGIIGAAILAAYIFHWQWTGFMASVGPDTQQYQPTKTLWDWLQLLVIPGVFLIVAFRFNLAANKNKDTSAQKRAKEEQERALDQQRETLLQEYLNRMSELLLNNDLRISSPGTEVRGIARARTLTVLYRLDSDRKGSLIRFLYESGLICKGQRESIIDLSQADLSGVNLEGANLSGVNLSQAKLMGANLKEADLSNANLTNADLTGANLINANFRDTRLEGANLSKVDLSGANLMRARIGQVRLVAATLHGSRLIEADLTEADLREASLYRANLKRADLTGAKLANADLAHADLVDAIYSKKQMETIKSSHDR